MPSAASTCSLSATASQSAMVRLGQVVEPERGDLAGDEQRHLADRDRIDRRDGEDVDPGPGERELDPRQVIGLTDRDQAKASGGAVR
jgi:hypothetical protein